MNKRKDGFTLAELLVVVAIIGVLVAISIPIFTSQREKARTAVCMANRRSLKAVLSADKMFDLTNSIITLTDEQKKEFTCPDGGNLLATFSDGSVGVFCDFAGHDDGDPTILNKVTTDVIQTYIESFKDPSALGIIFTSDIINSDYKDNDKSETFKLLEKIGITFGPIDTGNWQLTKTSFTWTPTTTTTGTDTYGIRYIYDSNNSNYKKYEVVSIKLDPSKGNNPNPPSGRINKASSIGSGCFYSSYSEALADLNSRLSTP